MIYDIFYASKGTISDRDFEIFRSRFPTAQKIQNVKSFEDIKNKSFTKFFWVVWDDTIIDDNFNFEYCVSKWDEKYIHVWKNGNFYDGISLFSKDHRVSNKEFDHRFYTEKKEIDVNASIPRKYDRFNLVTYDDYLKAIETSSTNMFWAVWPDIEIDSEFKFDYQVPFYNQHINHVFKNGKYYDGVCLFSKNKVVSKKEFYHRFYTERKEIDITASNPGPFDIVFISYDEVNADSNYEKLLSRFPEAKRVHGVKGIHQAHIEAAKVSSSDRFWVVDGDAEIADTFNFTTDQVAHYDPYNRQSVSVWFSQNPINGLVYGYGGVKLLPKNKTLKMDIESVDMTTSISDNFKIVPIVSNYTNFNTDPFNTWKSAFRECVKLASQAIDKNYQEETEERLKTWCTVGKEKSFGEYAIAGANAGKEYGLLHVGNKVALSMINDFQWLKNKFEKSKFGSNNG